MRLLDGFSGTLKIADFGSARFVPGGELSSCLRITIGVFAPWVHWYSHLMSILLGPRLEGHDERARGWGAPTVATSAQIVLSAQPLTMSDTEIAPGWIDDPRCLHSVVQV